MALPENIGQYKISRELGRGSMGTVYLGTQESLGREVAIKVLAPEFTREEEFLERFKREARTGGSLRHPNIVQVFDLGENDGYYYIAMEYMGPSNLKQMLTERGEKLPVQEATTLTEQILSALEHAHSKGIVHRDVKPANILISDQGAAVLTDFSIAQMKSASRLTQTGAAVGTPEYMAPEQFDGKGIDGRADLYAVGIIFYQMLSGVQPFAGDTVAAVMKAQLFLDPPLLSSLCPEISPGLSDFVRKALQKNREARYSSATEMLRELKRLTSETGQSGQPRAELESHSEHVPRLSLKEDAPVIAPRPPATPKFCPGCARPVVAGHRHCPDCGFELGTLVGGSSSSGSPQREPEPVADVPADAPFRRPGDPARVVGQAPQVSPLRGTEGGGKVSPLRGTEGGGKVSPLRGTEGGGKVSPLGGTEGGAPAEQVKAAAKQPSPASSATRTPQRPAESAPAMPGGEAKPAARLANAPKAAAEDEGDSSGGWSWGDILDVARQIVGFASILMFLSAAAGTMIHAPGKQELRQLLIFGSGLTLLLLTAVSFLLVGLEVILVRRFARIIVALVVSGGLFCCCLILKSLLAA